MLYAAPNRLTRHRFAKLDLPRSDSMRAPGDAIGLLALECAMDELARPSVLDPVDLRLRNDTEIDPEQDKPFASQHLGEALRQGAARFGRDKRVAKPASVSDGRWLIDLGVASAIRGDVLRNASARARLERDGRLTVELAMTDIGTGTYTILTQIAVEAMELPVDRVTVIRLRYPLSADRRLGGLVRIGDVRQRGSCRRRRGCVRALPCFLSSLRNSFTAAALSRRRCTSRSRTSPSSSTARHSQNCRPAIVTAISSRCHCDVGRGRLSDEKQVIVLEARSHLSPHGIPRSPNQLARGDGRLNNRPR
jgi:Molybdopterin-binding domain of aldehyde dehydrogenase